MSGLLAIQPSCHLRRCWQAGIVTSTYTLAVAMVLFASPVAASAQPVAYPQFFPRGQPPALVNPRLAQRTTLLCNDG